MDKLSCNKVVKPAVNFDGDDIFGNGKQFLSDNPLPRANFQNQIVRANRGITDELFNKYPAAKKILGKLAMPP